MRPGCTICGDRAGWCQAPGSPACWAVANRDPRWADHYDRDEDQFDAEQAWQDNYDDYAYGGNNR